VKYLKGHGYSTSWNYLFSLLDKDSKQITSYMLAKWPWGIEGTYTLMHKDAPRGQNCAQILMLCANALVMEKHKGEMVYGEANIWNAKPAIQAGFRALPSSRSGNVIHNIVVADNPIRLGELPEEAPNVTPPSYKEAPYVSYGVYRVDERLITPRIAARAHKILAL
jgi:hypothetical protein